jgi:WD40 repeat protein
VDQTGAVWVWSGEQLNPSDPFYTPRDWGAVTSGAVSQDGDWIALGYGGTNPHISVWKLRDDSHDDRPKPMIDPTGRRHRPRMIRAVAARELKSLAFSADNRLLLGLSTRGDIHLWGLENVAGPAVRITNNDTINAATLTSDGRLFVITRAIAKPPDEKQARVQSWSLDLSELLRLAARTAGRNLTLEEWEQFFPRTRYRPTFSDLAFPKYDGRYSDFAENLTTAEWKSFFPGKPYQKTFPDQPMPRDEL